MSDATPTVLCVDDDADVREILRILLEKNGFAVRLAGSAQEGVRLFRQSPPDAVVVDLMMEEIDSGVRFVRDLRALGNAAPVVMLSSVGDAMSAAIDPADLGLAGVLQKPIAEQTLVGLLRRKLGA
ncbi:MAG: response regulator [Planctomycetes bacterium]|nr:response regulator [Planctomycetota bacterium]